MCCNCRPIINGTSKIIERKIQKKTNVNTVASFEKFDEKSIEKL